MPRDKFMVHPEEKVSLKTIRWDQNHSRIEKQKMRRNIFKSG
jgi:hypothetical protein